MTKGLSGEESANFGRDARWFSAGGVNGNPESARLGEKFTVGGATHLGEAFEGDARGLADPGPEDDLVAKAGGNFVVNLVAQDDPADCLLRSCGSERFPMRGRNFLYPAKVDGVVDVVLLVDVRELNRDDNFEGVRRKFGFQDKTWRARETEATIPA